MQRSLCVHQCSCVFIYCISSRLHIHSKHIHVFISGLSNSAEGLKDIHLWAGVARKISTPHDISETKKLVANTTHSSSPKPQKQASYPTYHIMDTSFSCSPSTITSTPCIQKWHVAYLMYLWTESSRRTVWELSLQVALQIVVGAHSSPTYNMMLLTPRSQLTYWEVSFKNGCQEHSDLWWKLERQMFHYIAASWGKDWIWCLCSTSILSALHCHHPQMC